MTAADHSNPMKGLPRIHRDDPGKGSLVISKDASDDGRGLLVHT
jgi:hypothetical protein